MRKMYLLIAIAAAYSNAQNPLTTVLISQPVPLCHSGDCIMLEASYNTINATDQYSVSSIPYTPAFPFTGGTLLPVTVDDIWSPIVTLPFNFCFYGGMYNQILVGSNGVISFDIPTQTPNGFCPWFFNTEIPSVTFDIKNAIYGVRQDNNISMPPVVDPQTQNANYYVLDTGVNAAPNRVFVVNYNELPMFQCNASVGLQTSQIVLHESTNIIQVFVQKRTSCTSWNSGSGLIGIQNHDGTLASVPPGRNSGTWSAFNEGWQFTPGGSPNVTNLNWYANGVLIDNGTNPITVCPTEDTVFSASVSYASCDGDLLIYSGERFVGIPAPVPYGSPVDIAYCEDASGTYTADLRVNDEVILNGLPAVDYYVSYYTNQIDAGYGSNEIPMPVSFSYTSPTTIYVRVESMVTGCADILSFNLEIRPLPDAPSGDGVQYFTTGQALADLVVIGQNITWYDSAVDGSELPSETFLVSGTTYYASQSIDGCESRMSPGRLPVTVSNLLRMHSFADTKLLVFPNPATNSITVNASKIIDRYEIFTIPGLQIFQADGGSNEIRINVSEFASGTYLLKLYAGGESRIVKIIRK